MRNECYFSLWIPQGLVTKQVMGKKKQSKTIGAIKLMLVCLAQV